MQHRPFARLKKTYRVATRAMRGPRGVLLAAALAALVAVPVWFKGSATASPVPSAVAAAPAQPGPATRGALPALRPPRGAQWGNEPASAEARLVANWALHSGDHGRRAVVVVDKKNAKVYVFHPDGALQGAAPALLGSAVGDHTVPGVGDKPIAQVLPEERTTPAGRFIAEMGVNAGGEEVVWVDYDAAVSMHRVRPLVKAERRLERLASPTAADNRISFGCINLPVAFYENVLSPAVRRSGAVVYVLPETQSAAALFGAYEAPALLAGS